MSPAHRQILGRRDLRWPDEDACARDATALVRHAGLALRDALVTLEGPLGAGKTAFARHLLRAAGVAGRIKSPTFAILEPYEVAVDAGPPWAISHFDFYRFEDPHEWEAAGFRDVFGRPGLKIVEWPGRAEGLLPVPDLALEIEPGPADVRHVAALAWTERGLALLAAWDRECA